MQTLQGGDGSSGGEGDGVAAGASGSSSSTPPPTLEQKELVRLLTKTLTLDEFEAFVRANVPASVITVESLPESNVVRVTGSLLSSAEVDELKERLSAGWSRLQFEVGAQPWALARVAEAKLVEHGGRDVRVDPFVTSEDQWLFVSVGTSEELSAEAAHALIAGMVVSQRRVRVNLLGGSDSR